MEAVCKCHEITDESIELLVLKTLLTSVTSVFLRIHGDSLLKAVRTCYNIYLASKAVVNQTTAKASLIQMLVIVFRRMEADSSTVPVQAIVVADLMEPSERSAVDSNVTQFVQTFITKVVQDIEVVLSPLSSTKPVAHEGAFDTAASDSTDPMNYLESTDKDMLGAKYWEINMYKNALDERKGELSELDLDRYGDAEMHITNKLRRDAFLVFRALCKLSMKAPSAQEGTDPVSLRGKIIALELLKILLENAGEIFRTNDRYFVESHSFNLVCISNISWILMHNLTKEIFRKTLISTQKYRLLLVV
jgi:brefeldin A-inhibited guanine nucleotide-exchange protein